MLSRAELLRRADSPDYVSMVERAEGRVVGLPFASLRAEARQRLVVEDMLEQLGGFHERDFVYGLVVVAEAFRGSGAFAGLLRGQGRELPGRRAVLFINAANGRSVAAHLRRGAAGCGSGFKVGHHRFLVFSMDVRAVDGRVGLEGVSASVGSQVWRA